LVRCERQQRDAIADAGPREPASDRRTALVGLEDDENPPDPVELVRPLLFPAIGTGKPERRDAVEPEGVRIRLPLVQHHGSELAAGLEPLESVEAGLRAGLPAEPALPAIEPEAEPNGPLDAVPVKVGDFDRLAGF